VFRCYEDYDRARTMTLRFKIENVARTERFQVVLNGQPIDPAEQKVLYASHGRDARIHTVTLEPYQEYEVALQPAHLRKGENRLEITPTKLLPELEQPIRLREIELWVHYGD